MESLLGSSRCCHPFSAPIAALGDCQHVSSDDRSCDLRSGPRCAWQSAMLVTARPRMSRHSTILPNGGSNISGRGPFACMQSHLSRPDSCLKLTFQRTPPGWDVHQSWNRKRLSKNVRATLEGFEDEVGPNVIAAPPPTSGRVEILTNNELIRNLDLAPAHSALKAFSIGAGIQADEVQELLERTVGFQIDYTPVNPSDPRELSEFPDIRLWFVRLDSEYPWLPAVLDWKAGEWARYAAMLVPHQMTKKEGLVFNPEALELFVMNKMFHSYKWMRDHGITRPDIRCRDMLKMLGFKVDPLMFNILEGDADQTVLLERSIEGDKYNVAGRLDDLPPPSPPPPQKGPNSDYIPF